MRSVELFAGAGGLGLGLSLAGFTPDIVIEWDKWACETLEENKSIGYPLVRDWKIFKGDVRDFDFFSLPEGVDLVSGGPPCQPFSLGGKHQGNADRRDMFPAAVDVIRATRPRVFLFENVRGLTRIKFADYFQYIQLQLSFPELRRKEEEKWEDHLKRLRIHEKNGKEEGLAYQVSVKVLNACDFGIPQKRERVFIVGMRSDLKERWRFPMPTHSFEALLIDQWVSGEYWERHEIAVMHRPEKPSGLNDRIERLKQVHFDFGDGKKPWRTVRDAIAGLPDPRDIDKSLQFHNHLFQDGAKIYPGHTGSPMDLPAKTLKAGDHGVPGGENMLVSPSGLVRYFTIRESARLQTFPDGYQLRGSWTESMRQLGNAVPVRLAQIIGAALAEVLINGKIREIARNQTAPAGEKRKTLQSLG
jgi:DNA (cytosine-5)-methyltransferase 1